MREEELRDHFEKYGKVVDIKLKDKGGANIFAFIDFDDVRDAEEAL